MSKRKITALIVFVALCMIAVGIHLLVVNSEDYQRKQEMKRLEEELEYHLSRYEQLKKGHERVSEIYDNLYPESNDATRNESSQKRVNTNRTSGTSSKAAKSNRASDDEYNVKDYVHPDDFYYDHYDDFYDFEEAEDYYYEHGGR